MRSSGTYITSGIIEGRQGEVRKAMEACGFQIVRHFSEDDWHCFVAVFAQ